MTKFNGYDHNKKAQGFAMLTVIFVLIVVAGVAVMMSNMLIQGSQMNILSLQESRSYFSAASGLDWAVSKVKMGGGCVDLAGVLPKASDELYGSTITISCSEESYQEGNKTVKIFSLTSLAEIGEYGTDAEFVSRQLESKAFREE